MNFNEATYEDYTTTMALKFKLVAPLFYCRHIVRSDTRNNYLENTNNKKFEMQTKVLRYCEAVLKGKTTQAPAKI